MPVSKIFDDSIQPQSDKEISARRLFISKVYSANEEFEGILNRKQEHLLCFT